MQFFYDGLTSTCQTLVDTAAGGHYGDKTDEELKEIAKEELPELRQQLVELDEGFHLRIADMAGNSELRRMLVSLNERIRFIRWIDMENVGRDSTQHEHQEILQALTARDAALSERLLSGHIALRRDQIVDAIARGLARIYLPQEQAPAPAAP